MSSSSLPERETRIACGVAAAVVLALTAAPLLFGWSWFGLDLTRYETGVLCALQGALSRGDGPFISTTMGSGAALFAEPGAQLFYPPRWIALTFRPDLGANVSVVVHLTLAAAGAAWLARTFRLRAPAAAAAGIAFAASGPVVDLVLHGHYLVHGAWIGAAWAAARRALSPRAESFGRRMLVLALAAPVLGGEPQAFAVGAALASFEAGRSLLRLRRRGVPGAVRMGAAIAAALLVACVQLVPTLRESVLTRRSAGFDPAEALAGSLQPSQWPDALLPGLSTATLPGGAVVADALRAPAPGGGRWTAHPYLGLVVAGALLAAAFVRRARPPALVAAVALLSSVGAATPVFPILLRVVPGVASFRYPAKYLVVATLAAVIAAVISLDRARTDPSHRRRLLVALAAVGAVLAAVLATTWTQPDLFDARAGAPTAGLARALGLAAGQGLVVVALAITGVRIGGLRAALPFLAAVDLLAAALPTAQLGPALLRLPSATASLSRDGADVVCIDPALAAVGIDAPRALGPPGRFGQAAAWRTFGVPELSSCDGTISAIPYTALQSAISAELEAALQDGVPAAARALGCTVVVTARAPTSAALRPTRAPGLDSLRADDGTGVAAYAVTGALPRAFVVARPLAVADEDEVLRAILVGEGPDAARVVDDPLHRWGQAPLPTGIDARVVDVERAGADHVTIALAGTGGAVVALRTAFHVGWTARQADQALPVVRATGIHVAVVVQDVAAGPIELVYGPPQVGLGAALSMAGAAIAILVGRKRRLV